MRYGVGVDVSKGKSTIAIIDENMVLQMKVFEVEHNLKDMPKLIEILEKYGKEKIKIVMEETGNYHLPIYKYLTQEGFEVIKENAFKINKYLDREIRKSKTDKKDAKKLGEYVIENWTKLQKKEEEEEIYEKLRFLSRQYTSKVDVQRKLKVDLSNLCDVIFPGYYDLIDDDNIEVALDLLKMFYHSDIVKNLTEEEVIKKIEDTYKEKEHKRMAKNFGRKIHSLSQICIPSYEVSDQIQLAVESTVNCLKEVLKATNSIISEMEKIARELPEYEEIKKTPGIGDVLASRVIAEIGDPKKFKNAGSIIAYAGIDSPTYQSGNKNVEGIKISKRGNKYLRRVGYEIMLSIKRLKENKREGNVIYEYMVKKENEGKSKKVAKIAGLNKFLKRYYGMIKRIYKEEIESKGNAA